jgi:hypothetical protein
MYMLMSAFHSAPWLKLAALVLGQASFMPRTIFRARRELGSSAPMRFVLGSHASGFQVHIFASIPAAQYSRCRVLD